MGPDLCELVRIMATMLTHPVVAIDRTGTVLANSLFVGDLPDVAVVSANAVLSKRPRRLCR